MLKMDKLRVQKNELTARRESIRTVFRNSSKGFSSFNFRDGTEREERELPVKTLFLTLYGELRIINPDNNVWKLKTGEYVLFPRGTKVLLRTDDKTRYIEVKAKGLVSPELELRPYLVHSYKALRLNMGSRVVNRTVLAGDHAIMMIMRFSPKTGPVQYAMPGKAILFVLEGSGEFFYKKGNYGIFERQEVYLTQGDSFSVRTKEGLCAVLLITFE